MKQVRLSIALSCATVLVALTPFARAGEWDKKTIVNFRDPVEVPGAVLQPGTYVMKLLDSSSNRHIVEFMNERENHLYSMAMTIPAYRLQPSDKTVLTFYETPGGGKPDAIKTWYYPGDNWGQQFTYPKGRSAELASLTHQSVSNTSLSSRETTPEPVNETASTVATPAPIVEPPAENLDSSASESTTTLAQAVPPAPAPEPQAAEPAQSSDNSASDKDNLPKTASNASLAALVGLFSIEGALGVRKFRRRVN
jgi:hypothetical protein